MIKMLTVWTALFSVHASRQLLQNWKLFHENSVTLKFFKYVSVHENITSSLPFRDRDSVIGIATSRHFTHAA
jgi:hypothetical protein